MALRIAIHDSYELVAHGLGSMLHRHGAAVRLVHMSSGPVDIALCDPSDPTRSTVDPIARLRNSARVGKVVVYTWNFQPWMAKEWIRQGASGYLAKSLPAVRLIAALEAIHTGRVIVAPSGVSVASDAALIGNGVGLTPREVQTLSLIAAGLSNAEVAERMVLSINSVKSYVRSTYRKIGVESRSHAVLWGVARGLGKDAYLGRHDPVGRVRASM